MTAIEPYRDRGLTLIPPEGGQPTRSADNVDVGGIVASFRRHLRLFFVIIIATIALVILFLLVFPPRFTGTARVTINERTISTTPDKESPVVSQLPATESATDVPTEVQVIQSQRVIQRVIDKLHLDKDPEFSGDKLPFIPATIKFINGIFAPIKTTSKRDEIVTAVAAELMPEQYLTTNAIDINFTDHNPVKAQRIANAFAEAYLQDTVAQKAAQSQQAASGVLDQIERMREQADLDARNVQAYKIAHNLLSLGAQSLTEQEISTYNQQLAAAKADAAADEANLQTATKQLAEGSNGEDVGAALASPTISALRAQQSEISAKLALLEGHYGPKYPDLAQARQQLRDINQQIRAETQRIISNLSAKATASQSRVAAMDSTLAQTKDVLSANNAAQSGLENLTRQADVSQQIYEAYLARSKESIAQDASLIPDAQIVSYSGLPEAPSFPMPILFLPLGLVAGVLFGCAGVLIAEMTETRLMTADDVEDRLGCAYLGGVPLVASVADRSLPPADAVLGDRAFAYAEAFRALRPAIGYSMNGTAPASLFVTSALPKEGKTTVAIGLGRVSALQGVSTVIVDCDVRGHGLTRLLRLDEHQAGFLDVLAGTAKLADVLVEDRQSGARILPLGAVRSASEVLVEDGLDQLLSDLRSRASVIILDGPPLLAVAASRVIASKADATVLVTQWRKTRAVAVHEGLRMLPPGYVHLSGVVLNRVDVREIKKYGAEGGRFVRKFRSAYA